MLTALHLGNFKAFGETQTIPLRPLTLIFGPNSSGKSSIIHALLFAHEANRTENLDVQRTQLGGDSVDLGGVRQFSHRHRAPDFFTGGRRVELSVELDVGDLPQRSMQAFGPSRKMYVSLTIRDATSLGSYTIGADGHPLLSTVSAERLGAVCVPGTPAWGEMSGYFEDEHWNRLRFIDHTHPVFRQISVQQPSHAGGVTSGRARLSVLAAAAESLIGHADLRFDRLLPRGVVEASATSTSAGKSAVRAPRKKRPTDGLVATVRSTLLQLLDELVRGLSAAVDSELNRLVYLGPLRSYPPRHLAFDQHHDPNWQAGGGHAYDIARRDWKVREEINKWLGDAEKLSTPYELRVARLWPLESHRLRECLSIMADDVYAASVKQQIDGQSVADWSREDFEELLRSRLKFADYEAADAESDVGVDTSMPHLMWLYDKVANTNVSHRDVGIGISQVLPVLVHAFASQSRIIAIEQPEIHLHPKLQAELADVFIESALGERKNMFILETHSEHLILRVLRRIRETAAGELPVGLTPIRPEDVAVLYVSPTAEGSKVTEIPIRPDGEFAAPWPDGFFPDRAKELF